MIDDKDLECILEEVGNLAASKGMDPKAAVQLFRDAQHNYYAKKEEETRLKSSTEEGRLLLRIEKEAGMMIYGKLDKSAADYGIIMHRQLTELAYKLNKDGIPLDPFVGMGAFENIEMLRYAHNNQISDRIGEKWSRRLAKIDELVVDGKSRFASIVHYSIYTDARDAHGRQVSVTWSLITPPDLCSDVVTFFRNDPSKAFGFFNSLFEEPRYTAKRSGSLYLIDGDNIKPDEKGRRKINSARGDCCEVVKYTPGS
jgi:hypothetical protein